MNLEYIVRELKALPPALQKEAADFIEFLTLRKEKQTPLKTPLASGYSPLDYSKYKFEAKDLKFNREDINER